MEHSQENCRAQHYLAATEGSGDGLGWRKCSSRRTLVLQRKADRSDATTWRASPRQAGVHHRRAGESALGLVLFSLGRSLSWPQPHARTLSPIHYTILMMPAHLALLIFALRRK